MMILLASCAGGSSASDTKSRALVLPQVQEYTKAEQNRVADELEELFRVRQQKPMTLKMLKDYHRMQQETRAASEILSRKK